jgi:hypothetical protein
LQKKYQLARIAALDLLEYYKAISRKQDISWSFRGLKHAIGRKKVSGRVKKILISFIELLEISTQTKRNMILREIIAELSSQEASSRKSDQQDSHIIEQVDRIIVRNTAKPIPNKPGYYRWAIFLKPKEALNEVKKVTYTLHKTFPRPIRRISEKTRGFRLEGSGWGEFLVKVEIIFIDGKKATKYHWLKLGPTPLDT